MTIVRQRPPALATAVLTSGVVVVGAQAFVLAPPGAGARTTGRVLTGWSIALVAGVPLATVLGEAVGWRAAFGVLAALCAGQVALYALLPATPAAGPTRRAFRVALRAPGVAALLTGVLAYMAAFYGVFAFVGVEVRAVHGGGATAAGLVALAYGLGFGIAAGADRLLDRWGTARLVAPTLALLATVYLALAAAVGAFEVFLAVAVVWGLVNHVGLTLLVSRLGEVAPGLRGAVLALNTAATYGGAAVAGALAGPLYEAAGFGWLAAAAVLLALAVPVTTVRTN